MHGQIPGSDLFMKTMASLALALTLGFVSAPKLVAADGKTNPAPAYDTAKETDVTVIVADVREVPKADPLGGIHLTVKIKAETIDVYVGPTDFVKIFDVTFNKGQEIEVTGSKVKAGEEGLILAREIQVNRITLELRDKDGTPFWPTGKEPLPTGF